MMNIVQVNILFKKAINLSDKMRMINKQNKLIKEIKLRYLKVIAMLIYYL